MKEQHTILKGDDCMFNFIAAVFEFIIAVGIFVVLCWIAAVILAIVLIVFTIKLLAKIFSDVADGHEYRKMKRYKKHVDRYRKKHDI